MQMLSYVPRTLDALESANDYGAQIVANHSSRFGLLPALPTDNPDACLTEIQRGDASPIFNDRYATIIVFNNVSLSDPRLEPVWKELDARKAVIQVHPDANKKGTDGRPSPLIDIAFDTARVATDMLYKGVFCHWPNIKWVFAHSGGALPTPSGRLTLLSAESWVPDALNITREEIEKMLSRLYVNTATTAKISLAPAIQMVGVKHVVYGADCGVPCLTDATMTGN
jgi:predicted TIM-barrel fold metal-dependent hydrolase